MTDQNPNILSLVFNFKVAICMLLEMDSQIVTQKHENLLKHLIKSFCIDELSYTESVGIKGSLCIFTDKQFTFSIHFNEDFEKSIESSQYSCPENPVVRNFIEQCTLVGQASIAASLVIKEEAQTQEEISVLGKTSHPMVSSSIESNLEGSKYPASYSTVSGDPTNELPINQFLAIADEDDPYQEGQPSLGVVKFFGFLF